MGYAVRMGLFPKGRDLNEAPDRVELPVRGSDFGLRPRDVCVRLDAFLCKHLHWRSRSSVQKLIAEGWVEVALASPERPDSVDEPQVERRAGRKLLHGSRVVVHVPDAVRIVLPEGPPPDLVVLYEDEWLVAADKPAGVPVHPSGRHVADTLIQRVQARYPEDVAGGRLGDRGLKLCHRLDRETSGLLLVARQREAHRRMMAAFERRQVHKEYLALVHGVPERDAGVVDLPLGPSRTSAVHLKIAVAADGQSSRTAWRVVRRAEGCALLACEPHTGRQHQIRVHLDAIGHPLVGDKLYGVDESVFLRSAAGTLTEADRGALGLDRHALHNHRLGFEHPMTGVRVELECPLAPDMRAYLEEREPHFRRAGG